MNDLQRKYDSLLETLQAKHKADERYYIARWNYDNPTPHTSESMNELAKTLHNMARDHYHEVEDLQTEHDKKLKANQ